jgi:protein-S-isoprenylcysteine O-methyltransferase Ste14
MLLGGTSYRVWSIRVLGRLFSSTVVIREGHRLMTDGPYKHLRHPSYTGAFAAIVGVPVLLRAPFSIVVAILAMGSAYIYRIAVEERALVAEFGEEYSRYRRRTSRLIPFVW